MSGIRRFFHCVIPLGQTIFRSSNGRWICSYSQASEGITKEKCLTRRREFNLKKSDCHIHATLTQRLDAIHLLRHEHPIVRLCQALRVNRSSYYKRFHQPPAARTIENQQLRQHILTVYTETKYRLGASKIQVLLKRDYGITISAGRVYRLMKSMDLPKMSTSKPTYRYQKPTVSFASPNLLKQQFQPEAPNQAWVSDISYISVKRSFVYLCVILDLFSRKVIAWKVKQRMTASLVTETIALASQNRTYDEPVIFHSDQGSQYTSQAVRQALDKHQLVPSFSKKAYPWDNAVNEAFFKYMKKEELNRRIFQTLEDVELACFEYIEGFYNLKRPHGFNDMLTPDEKENYFFHASSLF